MAAKKQEFPFCIWSNNIQVWEIKLKQFVRAFVTFQHDNVTESFFSYIMRFSEQVSSEFFENFQETGSRLPRPAKIYCYNLLLVPAILFYARERRRLYSCLKFTASILISYLAFPFKCSCIKTNSSVLLAAFPCPQVSWTLPALSTSVRLLVSAQNEKQNKKKSKAFFNAPDTSACTLGLPCFNKFKLLEGFSIECRKLTKTKVISHNGRSEQR